MSNLAHTEEEIRGAVKMEIGILYIIAIAVIVYLLFGLTLYAVYRLTGGKLGFFRWWKKMEF